MANYMLLRNNHREGPFQLQQLLEKGLKPYDLVWVENKSAAWRYPTELEELKQFCNWVEEQPFDRFYKKNDNSHFEKLTREISNINERVTNIANNNQVSPANPISNTHISVILPTTKKNIAIDNTRVALPVYQQYFVQKDTENADSPQMEQRIPGRINNNDVPVFSVHPNTIKTLKKGTTIPVKMLAGMLLLLGAGIIIGFSINKKAFTTFSPSITDKESNKRTTPVTNMVTNSLTSTLPLTDVYTATREITSPAKSIADENDVVIPSPSQSSKKQQLNKKPLSKNTVPATIADKGNENLIAPEIKAAPVTKPVFKGSFSDLVQVTNNKYKIGAFGGVNQLQVSVNNTSPYKLHQVQVEIQYLLANDKLYKTEILKFEDLNPGITVMKEAPKSNRGIKIQTIVQSVYSTEVEILH